MRGSTSADLAAILADRPGPATWTAPTKRQPLTPRDDGKGVAAGPMLRRVGPAATPSHHALTALKAARTAERDA